MDCTVDSCKRPQHGHGWCKLHYKRWWRHGDPLWVTRAAKGTGTVSWNGYRIHCKNGEDKREHVAIVEKVLGHPLPPKAEVHHWDGNGTNNAHSNLVVCPDRAYHMLLHQRMRAKAACGNPNWERCVFCKSYGDPAFMGVLNTGMHYHPDCRKAYRKHRRQLGFKSC